MVTQNHCVERKGIQGLSFVLEHNQMRAKNCLKALNK